MVVLRLNSDSSAAAVARATIKDVLAGRAPDLRDVAVLLADELVTNALVHTSGAIVLSVENLPHGIRVEVSDTSPTPPLVRSPLPRDSRGRGMLIVDSLASSWGVVPTPDGKTVWFQLDTPDEREEAER